MGIGQWGKVGILYYYILKKMPIGVK